MGCERGGAQRRLAAHRGDLRVEGSSSTGNWCCKASIAPTGMRRGVARRTAVATRQGARGPTSASAISAVASASGCSAWTANGQGRGAAEPGGAAAAPRRGKRRSTAGRGVPASVAAIRSPGGGSRSPIMTAYRQRRTGVRRRSWQKRPKRPRELQRRTRRMPASHAAPPTSMAGSSGSNAASTGCRPPVRRARPLTSRQRPAQRGFGLAAPKARNQTPVAL